ncbi:MAG: toast rack family protein, partial [Candidatus Neomarinimicrobiota bacterium]
MKALLISVLSVCFAAAQTVVIPIDLPDLPRLLTFGNASQRQRERERERDREAVDLISEKYEFTAKDISRLNVGLEYSLASLNIAAGNKNQISGEIKYDRNHFIPRVNYDTYGNKGDLKIQIKSLKNDDWDYHAEHDEDDDRTRYTFNFDFDG